MGSKPEYIFIDLYKTLSQNVHIFRSIQFVPVIVSSDKTMAPVATGNNEYYHLCTSIGSTFIIYTMPTVMESSMLDSTVNPKCMFPSTCFVFYKLVYLTKFTSDP